MLLIFPLVLAAASPNPDDLYNRARSALLQNMEGSLSNLETMHAAAFLAAGGEGGLVHDRLRREEASVKPLGRRIIIWEMLADTSPAPEERRQWSDRIQAVLDDASVASSDRTEALHQLAKVVDRFDGRPLAMARAIAAAPPGPDTCFALWALHKAGDRGATSRVASLLTSAQASLRRDAANTLRHIRPTDAGTLLALARAADAELPGTAAYLPLNSAAFALAADPDGMAAWREHLEQIMNTGTPANRLLAVESLMPRYTTADLPRVAALLDDPAPDIRAAGAWTIVYVHRHNWTKAGEEIDLPGFKVRLGQPVSVTAQLGWGMTWPGQTGWAFAHPIPYLGRFSGGNLVVTYSMNPDRQDLPQFISAFQISRDGGNNWGPRSTVVMQHNEVIFIPKPDDSLLAIPSELTLRSLGEGRNFVGPAYIFENGGDRMVLLPQGIRVVDWPAPVDVHPSIQPPEYWHVGLTLTGSAIAAGRRILINGHAYSRRPDGRRMFHNLILASEDGGYTWRHFASVADYDPAHGSDKGYEGPNESAMIRLADGELETVFRVGNGSEKWKLHRTFSRDGGRSWSLADEVPAYSVRPSLIQLENGTIALASGRPGIGLWLADEPRSNRWQMIDLVAYHNRRLQDPSCRIAAIRGTTCYTSIVRLGPNRFLLAYDRCPVDQSPHGPQDRSRVFVVPIEVERDL